jgi:hypothetical protein
MRFSDGTDGMFGYVGDQIRKAGAFNVYGLLKKGDAHGGVIAVSGQKAAPG